MANIKSDKKTILTSKKANQANTAFKSALKTQIKKVEVAKSYDEANAELVKVYAKLDKACSKGLIHKNKAANLKSRLAKYVNSLK